MRWQAQEINKFDTTGAAYELTVIRTLVEFNRLRKSGNKRTASSACAAMKKAYYVTRNLTTSEEMQLAFKEESDSQQKGGDA